jgi:predicted negative regulator of RcsB-dependent stress response
VANPHETQEELDRLKSWWKEYGHAVILGVVLGLGALAGYRFWDAYQEAQREAASALYEQMLGGLQRGERQAVEDAGTHLLGEYAGTPYAGMAALLLARLHYEAGDMTGARGMLQWAVDKARDPGTVHAARLRLARVLAEAGEFEEAFRLLEVKSRTGFESEYHELLGDLYMKTGRAEEARAAYRAALERLPEGSAYAAALRMKLYDLGEGASP